MNSIYDDIVKILNDSNIKRHEGDEIRWYGGFNYNGIIDDSSIPPESDVILRYPDGNFEIIVGYLRHIGGIVKVTGYDKQSVTTMTGYELINNYDDTKKEGSEVYNELLETCIIKNKLEIFLDS